MIGGGVAGVTTGGHSAGGTGGLLGGGSSDTSSLSGGGTIGTGGVGGGGTTSSGGGGGASSLSGGGTAATGIGGTGGVGGSATISSGGSGGASSLGGGGSATTGGAAVGGIGGTAGSGAGGGSSGGQAICGDSVVEPGEQCDLGAANADRPAFVVKAVAFVGNDPAGDKYRDSQDIEGCLRDLHKETMSFLTRNLRRLQGEKGINTEGDLEVPLAALEELVVNMLLHRDYFISAPWRVMLFDNRIELISPGALPNNLTIENIRNGVSVIRNPLLASFATKGDELPYRGIGTGIRRALAGVPNLELESDHERNLFTAKIPRNPA